MERERNSDNAEETTLELNDESSSEGSETTEIDIEGGEISGELDAYENPIDKHKAITTRWLAYLLIIILGGSFIIHYGVMAWLAAQNKIDAMKIVEQTFSAWLPIISGLAAAAVTYFFTRERNGKK
jgi:hypothetical protein